MSALSRFKASAATAALCFVVPTLLWSQVIIKERVEIKPKQPKASLPAKTAGSSVDYFNPPLFIEESGSPLIPLPCLLTISGQVDILGAIGGNQYAKIVLSLNPYLEYEIAWKGRDPIPWGGNMYEGQSPYTGVFDKGGAPSLYMLTFDGQFGTGAKQISITEAGLSWTFSSYLNQGSFPRVDVTGSAIATGSVVPEWRFGSWWGEAYPSSLSCGQVSRIDFLPLDGANRLYEPYGIPRSEALVTLSVEAKGEYAYLRCGDQEGKEITISLADASDARLVLDTSRGEIAGERDTARVTLTGGGESAETLLPLFCEKLHHFRIIADPLEVEHGSRSKLTVIAEDINDQEVVLDQDPELTFWLSSPYLIIGSVRDTGGTGGKRLPGKMLMKTTDRKGDPRVADDTPLYGSFTLDGGPPQPDYVTAQYSVARQGKVEYLADGQIPYGDAAEPVVITVEKTEDWTKSGSVELLVGPSICAQVTFDPATIAPGDTAQLSFKKINDDGTLEDFPPDQLFNVGILSGDGDRGVLVSTSGEVGTTLARAPAPIRYIAPESIEGETLIVNVIATAAFSSGSSSASVKSTGKHAISPAKSTAARPDSASIQTQKKAELERVRAKLIAQASGTCSPGNIAIAGGKPELVILEILPKVEKFKITDAPEMPRITIKAQLKNFSKGEVIYNWLFITHWISREPRTFRATFEGKTTAQNSEASTWPVSWNQMTRGGDDISVFVLAIADNQSYDTKKENLPNIIGTDPSIDQIREGLTIEEQVIVFMESSPKWKHFDGKGFPIFGSPHGYGLMQIDNPRATDEEVWNWRANKAAGKRLYNQKKTLASSYSSRINDGKTWYWNNEQHTKRRYNDPINCSWYPIPYLHAGHLTEGELLLKEAFQRYNGGVYWRWIPERPKDKNSSGKWEKVTTSPYGDNAWKIYDDISNHNTFPTDWN